MNGKWKALIIVIAVVGVFVGIFAGYKLLTRFYSPQGRIEQTSADSNMSDAEETSAPAETTEGKETTADVEQTTEEFEDRTTGEPTTEEPTTEEPTTEEPTTERPTADHSGRDKVIDFTVKDSDGNDVNLADLLDKPIVVNFWATWCGPCREELPYFERAAAEYGDRVNFMMVNLTDGYSDTVRSVKRFIREYGFTFPVYFDTEESAAYAYGISAIPMTLFINSDGTIAEQYIGGLSERMLNGYIEALLADE